MLFLTTFKTSSGHLCHSNSINRLMLFKMVKPPGYNHDEEGASPSRSKVLVAVQIVGTFLILFVNVLFLGLVLSKSKSTTTVPGNAEEVTIIINPVASMMIDDRDNPANKNESIILIKNSEEASDVILYDNRMYEGKSVMLQNEDEGCTNILDFNDKVSSVLIDSNNLNGTTCIRLYEHSACLGLYIDVTSESSCKDDLSICNFDNETSSVSRCDFPTPEDPKSYGPEHIRTAKGLPCKNHCGTHGDNWHSCFTDDLMTDWDYCSPRPEVDYYGYECKDLCAFRNGKDYTSCNLKKGGWGYCSAVVFKG